MFLTDSKKQNLTMSYLLGFDVGSSAVKIGILDLNGRTVVACRKGYPTEEPRPGFKEQNPELWWEAVVGAIREVTREIDTGRLLAIGSAGNICSHTFLDERGKLLRPSLGFQDQRAASEVDELLSATTRQELASELGADFPPAATWPLPRLLWFRKNEPAILERTRYLIHAKDFINFRLTGEIASDVSSNRGLVNLSSGLLASTILKKLKLPDHFVPRLHGPEQVMGRVSTQAAVETGLPPGLPVVAGWNDLNASVLGSGLTPASHAFDITGTSEHVGIVNSSTYRAAGLISIPFFRGKHLFYGVTSNGGGALTWYARALGMNINDMLRLAEATPAGCEGLMFLPYLDGERAPVWDPRASAAFVGIRSRHDLGHFVRAILEGVVLGLQQIWELLKSEAGAQAGPIVASGGAARAHLWNQIKADVWGRELRVLENVDAAVVGAAILAAVGTAQHPSFEVAADAMVRTREACVPARRDEFYQHLGSRYRRIYPALRQIFSEP